VRRTEQHSRHGCPGTFTHSISSGGGGTSAGDLGRKLEVVRAVCCCSSTRLLRAAGAHRELMQDAEAEADAAAGAGEGGASTESIHIGYLYSVELDVMLCK